MPSTRWVRVPVVCLALLALASPGRAEDPPAAPPSPGDTQQRIEHVESQVKTIAEELQSLKSRFVLPETAEYKSLYGLGPAASKVYGIERGLSIGGYGEANFSFLVGDRPAGGHDTFDFVRFILYAGYKFSDRLVLNSEIEFEHAKVGSTVSAGSGDVEIEFAYLDFRLVEEASVRGGLLLIPMGFLNEVHEPPTYFGNKRPEVEQRIIPTTWRSGGAGLYGELPAGFEYRTYAVTSFNAAGFTDAGIRGGRQSGNREFADDLGWTGRLDWAGIPGVLVGGSFFWGDTGQDLLFAGREVDANLILYDFHAQLQWRGLHVRGLVAQGHLDDADILTAAQSAANRPVADRFWGAYGEVAYDVLPLIVPGTRQYLAPFVRYERLTTQADVPRGFQPDETRDLEVVNVGVSYKPLPNVVIKADYRNLSSKEGTIADELNLGLGFNF
jgi:hypothetical protein